MLRQRRYRLSMRLWLLLPVVVLACAACGGTAKHAKLSEHATQQAYVAGLGKHDEVATPLPSRAAVARHARACEGSRELASADGSSYAALVTRPIVVRSAPTRRSSVVDTLETRNLHGFAQVLGVVGVHRGSSCRADWYRVQLPVLPNRTTGWIRPWALKTFRGDTRIAVDLSERRLVAYRRDRVVMSVPVAVGAPGTPTPVGSFYVDERYIIPDASGPFGPNAIGISAHSDALKDVWVDDGPIGIHGTNEPGSIGLAASHGCIRVANASMRRLFDLAPAGTPVVVSA